ncbi:MAG TPA: serine hydrolase [Gemmatimonadaceae bacterium]|nr:serine hydrolase [Gemmatimonadaceae bacterium]
MLKPTRFARCVIAAIAFATAVSAPLAAQAAKYFPPPGQWQRKSPSEVGMDSVKLKAAIDLALSRAATWDFDRDQLRTFGRPLGPVPKTRAGTNGIVVRHGYIVAEFGDVKANDPVYSVAKSFLSTVAGIAVDRGLIKNVNDPVANYVKDGGYDSPHNAAITWKNHLQQESEWEGVMWGKNANFLDSVEFGNGRMRPRDIRAPGTYYEYNDARINRFALSLLRVFGRGVPDVLKSEIMDPIGASNQWRWVPYENSMVEIGGKQVGSVSGGTRWGGGLWINSEDLARFGLLALNRGKWGNKQIVSDKWWTEALAPSATQNSPDYGYLWWLNTRKGSPNAPATSYQARGNGSNTIYVDPENDLVFVWHWHSGSMDGGRGRGGAPPPPSVVQMILASITDK